jgi:threonine-phosphate decarboxylase
MHPEFIPEHGGQMRDISAHFGIAEESLLDFSASISPLPPSDALTDALCESIRAHRILTCYPDTQYTTLKRAIAQYAGVAGESISVGNGVMPLLAAAVNAIGARKCLVLAPAFGGYRRVLAACGTDCFTLAAREEDHFMVDCDDVLAGLKSAGAQALLLANPNSPSGHLMPAAQLGQLQQAASALGVVTIVDEAFIDYSSGESLSGIAAQRLELIVLRSITKFFAIPGLRVGYAICHPRVRCGIDATMPLWAIDSIAAEAARLALLDVDSAQLTRVTNITERTWLSHQLREIGLTVFPGNANYLLMKVQETRSGLELWRRLILEYGVVLRSCANFEGLNQQYLRVGIRTRSDNERLVSALEREFGL